jgi:hypothetical protein
MLPFPAEAVMPVGESGIVAGVTEFEIDEAELVPNAFVAVIVKVYRIPLVKPVTVIGEVPPLAEIPFGFETTV